MPEAKETIRGEPWVYLASSSPQRRAILEELGIPYQLLPVDVEEIVAATPRETVEENASRKLLAGLRAAKKLGAKPVSSGWPGLPNTEECVGGPWLQGLPVRGDTVRRYLRMVRRARRKPRTPDPEAAALTHVPTERGVIVIAADTVLEAQGRLLGKPADAAMAIQYLQTLSGGSAVAYSAVAVARTGDMEGILAMETAEVHFKPLAPEAIRWYLSTGEPMGRAGAFGISRLGEVLTESIDGCHSCIAGLPKTALIAALTRVAGPQIPAWLRALPATIFATRVRFHPLVIPLV